MRSQNDIINTLDMTSNKHYAANTSNNNKEAKPLNFYNDGTYGFINIHREIIMRLKITPDDKFTQEAIDDDHIVLTRHKVTT